MLEVGGTEVKLTPTHATTINTNRCTITYRTLKVPTKKVSTVPTKEIDKVLESIKKILFYTRGMEQWK